MLRILTFFMLLGLTIPVVKGADEEAGLYTQAAKSFSDQFYERAEQQFGELVSRFPGSTNVGNAILLQAQSRFFQRRYQAAVELLKQNVARAGSQADDFEFWVAEALREEGNYPAAAENYRALLTNFPQSPLALKASYLEAFCAFQLKDLPRTIELLRGPDGMFQKLSSAAPADLLTMRGHLLLGNALISTGKIDEARKVIAMVNPSPEQPEFGWEKNQLLARVEFASPNPEEALAYVTNALKSAQAGKKPLLEAQSRNLEADVYRKLNRNPEAVGSYEKIGAIEGLPVEQKRLALLKTVELLSASGNTTNAIARVESYLAMQTNEPATDLLRLKAAELWMDQFRQLSADLEKQRTAATNSLAQARTHLSSVLAQYTNSPHLGRVWLDLGLCYWEEGTTLEVPNRIPESEAAFGHAAETLNRSDDQALAVFKIADAQFYLKHDAPARSNYLAVVRNYTDLPQVKNALLDKAYRQLVRTSIALKDFESAQKFLKEFREAFPNSPLTEETTLLYGQALADEGHGNEARTVFQDFMRNYPGSTLEPEVRLAEARSYATEGDLQTALKKHDEWLRTFTNSTLRGSVEFRRAVLQDRAGQRGNALGSFTNFVSQFPTNPFAPAAQSWVADYYYEQEQWPQAELNYQRLFQNTNWATHPLAYEARLMAAKTAFKRQSYSDARGYLTNLINVLNANPKASAELVPEAYFVLGDVFLEEPITGTTNSLHNFVEAARVFDLITAQYPSNKLAILALGKKGDCHLQLASTARYPESFAIATNAYWQVLRSEVADVPIAALNQAEVGLGIACKNLAESKSGEEREQLQKEALDHFLNVVYGTRRKERPDPYYLKMAGLEAARLAEALGKTSAAMDLYRRLVTEAPSLKTFWEARMSSLRQRVASADGQ